jgi:hypothetical protein
LLAGVSPVTPLIALIVPLVVTAMLCPGLTPPRLLVVAGNIVPIGPVEPVAPAPCGPVAPVAPGTLLTPVDP